MAEEKKEYLGTKERTVVLVKPDGVLRGLVGEILGRFERVGLKIVGLKMVQASREMADKHYGGDQEWLKNVGQKTLDNNKKYNIDAKEVMGTSDPLEIGEKIQKWMVDFLTSAPVIVLLLEGNQAIENVRKLTGNTLAVLADPGTIRGDLASDSAVLGNLEMRAIHNIIHASGDTEDAGREEALWFSDDEKFDYVQAADKVMFRNFYK